LAADPVELLDAAESDPVAAALPDASTVCVVGVGVLLTRLVVLPFTATVKVWLP
jgi:hypothetical protein